MNKKTILLDVDNVICFNVFLHAINEFLKTSYTIDDFTNYFIDKAVIPENKFDDFKKYLKTINLYDSANTLPLAIETIEKLNNVYDIFICSSCIDPFDIKNSGKLFMQKYDYLLRILPFMDPNKFIFTNSKQIINADIQIDDLITNFNNDIKTKILFPSFHNTTISNIKLMEQNIIRAGFHWSRGWLNIQKILLDENNQEKKVYTIGKKNTN